MDTFPQQLADNLWALGNYHYNLYLVRGASRTALVEVGVSAVVDEVLRQLEELGAEPDYLVVTHPHADHLTGLAGLRERFPEAAVLAGAGTREFAEHPKAARNLVQEDRYIHEAMAEKGYPPGRSPVEAPPSLSDARVVGEGDRLDLGGVTVGFLEAKGHSPGHLAVEVPEASALLVSDAVGFPFPGRGFFPMFFTGYRDYLLTLERIGAIAPRVLGFGHQGFALDDDVPRLVDEAAGAARALLDRVLAHEGDDAALAERLFDECYRDELTINSDGNIRGCVSLLIKRCRQAAG